MANMLTLQVKCPTFLEGSYLSQNLFDFYFGDDLNPSKIIAFALTIYLLGLDILARPSGVLHLYTYTTPVLHLLTPINFLVWVENITCFLT